MKTMERHDKVNMKPDRMNEYDRIMRTEAEYACSVFSFFSVKDISLKSIKSTSYFVDVSFFLPLFIWRWQRLQQLNVTGRLDHSD